MWEYLFICLFVLVFIGTGSCCVALAYLKLAGWTSLIHFPLLPWC